MQSDHIDKIAEALAQAQGEIQDPHKNKEAKAGTYSYKYADIADVLKVVRTALSKHQICIVQPTILDGEFIIVRTRLIHKSGQFLESDYPVCKAIGEHQKMGAAMTYARRYALCSIVGVAADEDTDAANASAVEVAKAPSGAHMKRALKELDNELVDIGSMPMTMKCFQAWQEKMDKEHWPSESVDEGNYRHMVRDKFTEHRGRLEAVEIKGDSQADMANQEIAPDIGPVGTHSLETF